MMQNLRPIVTVIGGQRLLESITKLVICNSQDQRMDYESVDFTYNFDTRRDAKSFDKYNPQGILKLSWTTKCRKFIPACIVLVFDWCGGVDSPILESPDWKHKEATILKHVRKFKEQCKGRLVKICVLCYLGSTNEEIILEEKLSQLKKNGEIDSKGVFLVKHKLEEGEMPGKIKKYLWDGCISHYKDEIDRLKKLKSRAHKELSGNFMEIQIRYNFKMGFYSELKQDKDLALNFYKKAYKELQDPTVNQIILLDEKRSVADLIVHRIQCVLLNLPNLLSKLVANQALNSNEKQLLLDRTKESIGLFKSHILTYKVSKNITCAFEYWKWLGEHFSRFGTLLESMPEEVYEKDNFWTHPGFYFQAAGVYYIMRMKVTVEDTEFLQSVVNWQGFIANSSLRIKDPVFLGKPKTLAQHPCEADVVEGMSLSDQSNIIKILEEAEIKHLPIALEYLFRALKFYKTLVPMTKICSELSYMLANLYKKKGDYNTDYAYKSEIVSKIDGWEMIQEGLLDDLISCADNSQKVQDLIQYTLKALEIHHKNSDLMFEKLNNTLTGNLIQINTCGIIKAKAKFEVKNITTYSPVVLNISFTNTLLCSLSPIKVSLFFSDPSFNCENFQTISLDPGLNKKISYKFVIKSLSLQELVLLKIIARYEPADMSWIDFEIKTHTKVLVTAPTPQLSPTFNHLPFALIGEEHILTINLHPYSELSSLKIMIYEDDRNPSSQKSSCILRNFPNNYMIFNNENMILEDGIFISHITSPQTLPLKTIFYQEKNYSFKVKFSYTVHKDHDIIYNSEEVYVLDVSAQLPFQILMKWMSIIEPLKPIVLNIQITNDFPLAFYLSKIALVAESDWKCEEEKKYYNLKVAEGNWISEYFVVKVLNIENACNIDGFLLVTWSRDKNVQDSLIESNGSVSNICKIPIVGFSSVVFPLDIEVIVGSEFFIGQVFEMIVVIRNKTKLDLEARIVIEETMWFLVGGGENAKFEVKGVGEKVFKFCLVGVEAGIKDLPKVNVNLAEVTRSWQGKVMILP
ncbi:hypothetical protein SteCoe_21419 [Stentor coeruleus]|uniref:Trafficking protein particle complex subunit 11 domain-containing protein n=1 Tax=Stentor coeruleus TaxID=5963 RepID=A0A1R2BPR8_9CILI|nr:hypothetical protein SteCoe_21419 [Stentor coeruleus]